MIHGKSTWLPIAAAVAAGIATFTIVENTAEACGCLSPPVPEFDDDEFAVNQQAEQIIFEVEDDGHVTAHVLIRYAGRPDQFAWIVPTPTVPDLELGSDVIFGILEGETAPQINVSQPSFCPSPEFRCESHSYPRCDFGGVNNETGNNSDSFNNAPGADAGTSTNNAGMEPVTVIKREQIGAYDTVVFTAEEAELAVGWLNDNGFIVNDTMTPYMQPYLDAGMVFVASKLVAGAGIDQIKPLKMRYESTKPMIPLQLTAVAAEPHLTVTSYIVNSSDYFEPQDRPVVGVSGSAISIDQTGRQNYPMVISRLIDEAGGDGFVIEYAGDVPEPTFDNCCSGDFDSCGVSLDGLCQCPLSEFDAEDCGEQEDLMEGFTALEELRAQYTHMTRLTTRLSPHEMTFDPVFRRMTDAPPIDGRLTLNGQRRQMFACEEDIIDTELYSSIEDLVGCATTYCGNGTCATDGDGNAGCVCEPGFAARQFNDLDGLPSVTCVPETHTIDLAAGGLDLPSSCKPSTCGSGTCLDVGGFAACECPPNSLAFPNPQDNVPSCGTLTRFSGDSGARDYTGPMEDVRACAPAPPTCGEFGWLVPNDNIARQGVVCPSSLPDDDSVFEIPPEPTCEDIYPGYDEQNDGDPAVDNDFDGNPDALEDKEVSGGCGGGDGCSSASGNAGGGLLALLLIGFLRRRRR